MTPTLGSLARMAPSEADDAATDCRPRKAGSGVAATSRQLNRDPTLIGIAAKLREVLPGDSRVEETLSADPDERWAKVGRNLEQLTAEKPGLLGQLGLGALQALRSLSESGDGDEATEEATILFTDLVDFSTWALKAGDGPAVRLLREVVETVELAVLRNHGEVVKWIGDGMMAAFRKPKHALEAVIAAHEALAEVEVDGYRPLLRAGIHSGRPRRDRSDYLGVDVNIAARVAEAAGSDELLVSAPVAQTLEEEGDADGLSLKRKRFFKGKGVPKEMAVYSLKLGK